MLVLESVAQLLCFFNSQGLCQRDWTSEKRWGSFQFPFKPTPDRVPSPPKITCDVILNPEHLLKSGGALQEPPSGLPSLRVGPKGDVENHPKGKIREIAAG